MAPEVKDIELLVMKERWSILLGNEKQKPVGSARRKGVIKLQLAVFGQCQFSWELIW